jgi:hypothetical protein
VPRSVIIANGGDVLDRCTTERYFRSDKTTSGVERHEYACHAQLVRLN